MEKDINKIISTNLTKLRKQKKLTQLELANKFNFSDKTISKWESAESLPNIEVLCKLAEFYGLTLNDLTNENLVVDEIDKKANRELATNKIIIAALAISIVWIITTIIYTYVKVNAGHNLWILFIWALPMSLVVALIFNSVWGSKRVGVILFSLFLWATITSIFLQFLELLVWPIFIIGIPSQIAIILWSGLKTKKK